MKRPNKNSSINHAGVSKCCKAPIKVACGDDGDISGSDIKVNEMGRTCWVECQKCFKDCDIES